MFLPRVSWFLLWEKNDLNAAQRNTWTKQKNSAKWFLFANRVHQNPSQASMHTLWRWHLSFFPNSGDDCVSSHSPELNFTIWCSWITTMKWWGRFTEHPCTCSQSILNLHYIIERITTVSWQPSTSPVEQWPPTWSSPGHKISMSLQSGWYYTAM